MDRFQKELQCNILPRKKNFKWKKEEVKPLGGWFSTDQDMVTYLNYND